MKQSNPTELLGNLLLRITVKMIPQTSPDPNPDFSWIFYRKSALCPKAIRARPTPSRYLINSNGELLSEIANEGLSCCVGFPQILGPPGSFGSCGSLGFLWILGVPRPWEGTSRVDECRRELLALINMLFKLARLGPKIRQRS